VAQDMPAAAQFIERLEGSATGISPPDKSAYLAAPGSKPAR